MNVCQNAFQIFLVIQKLNHIFHSKPLLHYFLNGFVTIILSVISAYKDPVENHHMKKIIDKFVTWIFCQQYMEDLMILQHKMQYVKPNQHTIIVIYDVLGNRIKNRCELGQISIHANSCK